MELIGFELIDRVSWRGFKWISWINAGLTQILSLILFLNVSIQTGSICFAPTERKKGNHVAVMKSFMVRGQIICSWNGVLRLERHAICEVDGFPWHRGHRRNVVMIGDERLTRCFEIFVFFWFLPGGVLRLLWLNLSRVCHCYDFYVFKTFLFWLLDIWLMDLTTSWSKEMFKSDITWVLLSLCRVCPDPSTIDQSSQANVGGSNKADSDHAQPEPTWHF